MKKTFKSKVFRWAFRITVILAIVFELLIWFSPYYYHPEYGKKMIAHTVEIDAPVEKVFAYLGKSANASRWSVFVDHITPLPNGVPDGQAGSLRRCFCNSNEQGTQWDEEITLVEKNKRRQLRIFNMVDFSMTAQGLRTEQLYTDLGHGKTKLTFTVFYMNHEPSLWEEFKTHIASYKMKKIFRDNMNNIKQLVEAEK